MAHELPALPYSHAALEPHIDARTMEMKLESIKDSGRKVLPSIFTIGNLAFGFFARLAASASDPRPPEGTSAEPSAETNDETTSG